MQNAKTGAKPTFILPVGFGASCLILIGFINNDSAWGLGFVGMGGILLTSALLQYRKVQKGKNKTPS